MSDFYISREQAESDLLAAAAFVGERVRSSDGHAAAMNAILPMYLDRGEVDLAAELANSVNDPYSRDKLLATVAEKCAEIDDDEYALQLADAIEDQGLQSQATERVALVLAGKGNIEKAREIADSMAHPDFVLAGIAAKQAEDGDETAARVTVAEIDFPSARVSASQHIASSLIVKGENESAVAWLDDGVEAAEAIEHDEERIRTLSDLSSLYVEAKRNDKSIETLAVALGFAEQLDNTHRDFFFGNCAIGFLNAGSVELADQALDLIADKTQLGSALVGFARDSWKKDEKDDALEALEEAYTIVNSQREIEIRDSRARNRLFTIIAAQFAGFGKTERGIEIARGNADPAEETDALSQIAQILIAQNEDELARQTINEIAEDADRLSALIALADAKLKSGDASGSIEMLKEAATLAETVPQLPARSTAMIELAARFADQGDQATATEICLENLDVVAEVRDQSTQAVLLSNLSFLSARNDLGLAASGRKTIQQILGSNY